MWMRFGASQAGMLASATCYCLLTVLLLLSPSEGHCQVQE
jgi:hypothetical protein